ncbi:MAG TPA: choice-of-anchor D domain-containing protein, partial [Candidatus Kapabacteria bacterium]|nr:choice-of-anchor D domain-containing protein [Candidatus Kapabacteria bacterium]
IACDDLDILAAYLTDTSLFHLDPLLLPLQLQPKESLGIRLRGAFQHPSVYTDSLHVTLRYGTAHTIKDTVILIAVHVSGITLPAVSDLTVRTANGCQPIDTVIHVKNLHCNAGTLDSMSMGDPTVSQARDTTFPLLLPPDSSVPVRIRVFPPKSGSALATITLHFDIDSTIFDTVIYVTVINKTDPNPHPILSQNKIAFGSSSLCFGKQVAFLYRNVQCDTMLLMRARWSFADSEISFDSVIVPTVLAPGETDTMLFHFTPTGTRNANATLTLTFELNGLTKDTTINLTGKGTDAATATLAPDTLAFPSITKCDASTDSTLFINTSCDTLTITSLQDLFPDGFVVISPASLPITVAPGDSIPIVLRFAPGTDGKFADSINLKYNSTVSPGSFVIQRMKLAGSSATPFTPAKLGPANFSNLHLAPCSELDT